MTILYHKPKLTLLAQPTFTEPEHLLVNWVDDGAPATDAERLAEFAGRLCYMSQANVSGRSNQAYLEHIERQGHGSVLEHANLTVLSEQVSRSLTHELVRHRAGWAYSMLSQRYVDESEVGFVVPPAILDMWDGSDHGDRMREMYIFHADQALEAYKTWVTTLANSYKHIENATERRKLAREAARWVLPNATETKIVATANARAWRFVLALRGAPGADREIRRWAVAALRLLKDAHPHLFHDMAVDKAPDGQDAVTTAFWKV